MAIDLTAKIPNNVDLANDPKLQRALEHWQPKYLEWWMDMGPSDFAKYDIYLRTAIGVGKGGWANFGHVKMPDYRWGIFLAEPEPDRRIPFGDHFGEPAWQEVPGEVELTDDAENILVDLAFRRAVQKESPRAQVGSRALRRRNHAVGGLLHAIVAEREVHPRIPYAHGHIQFHESPSVPGRDDKAFRDRFPQVFQRFFLGLADDKSTHAQVKWIAQAGG